MRDRGCSYAELERRGWALPVRKIEIRYRAPAYYEEELAVRTHVGRTGHHSIVFESEVVRVSDDVTIATGSVELACIRKDAEVRRPLPLPDELIALLGPG
jgi:acyl-CoA thioester hydrolase